MTPPRPTKEASSRHLLEINQLDASYGYGRRGRRVLEDVSITLDRGRTMGIVGESGSGKSTVAKTIVGSLVPLRGTVVINGQDVHRVRRPGRNRLRRTVQLVPQDPHASLDPRMRIRDTLTEAISPRGRLSSRHRGRVDELLALVSLDASAADRFPHQFSGGQRQRIAIARALAVQPELLIADEITSALDASIQHEVLTLLQDLQSRLGFGCIFITHHLGAAAHVCDELTVMQQGRVVEQGAVSLLHNPAHPYTCRLVDSVPTADGRFLRVESP